MNTRTHRDAFSKTRTTDLVLVIVSLFTQTAFCEALFNQIGIDPSFQEVLKSGALLKGENSERGVKGSKIHVNRQLVELTPAARHPIETNIMIHTLGNSAIPRANFHKWSRWYQEDGSTQVFRLFKGEENLRNARTNAARIEAFSKLHWERGPWHEWSGTYTIIEPHGAAIFQVKNNVNDWAVQLNMNAAGDIILNHRRGADKVLATNMVEKPFFVRVRDNGQDYEVFLDGKEVGEGTYVRPEGRTAFRWGMYVGHNEVNHDAMVFVSGATVDAGEGKR